MYNFTSSPSKKSERGGQYGGFPHTPNDHNFYNRDPGNSSYYGGNGTTSKFNDAASYSAFNQHWLNSSSSENKSQSPWSKNNYMEKSQHHIIDGPKHGVAPANSLDSSFMSGKGGGPKNGPKDGWHSERMMNTIVPKDEKHDHYHVPKKDGATALGKDDTANDGHDVTKNTMSASVAGSFFARTGDQAQHSAVCYLKPDRNSETGKKIMQLMSLEQYKYFLDEVTIQVEDGTMEDLVPDGWEVKLPPPPSLQANKYTSKFIELQSMKPVTVPNNGAVDQNGVAVDGSENNNELVVNLPDGEMDQRTTMMLRHIPNKYTQAKMLEVFKENGMEGKYDFFYLPIDLRNRCNVGYAFVNFISPNHAREFIKQFNGLKLAAYNSPKVCVVAYARVQGLEANIEVYRNSPISGLTEPTYRPLIFKNGQIVEFPKPDAPPPLVQLREDTNAQKIINTNNNKTSRYPHNAHEINHVVAGNEQINSETTRLSAAVAQLLQADPPSSNNRDNHHAEYNKFSTREQPLYDHRLGGEYAKAISTVETAAWKAAKEIARKEAFGTAATPQAHGGLYNNHPPSLHENPYSTPYNGMRTSSKDAYGAMMTDGHKKNHDNSSSFEGEDTKMMEQLMAEFIKSKHYSTSSFHNWQKLYHEQQHHINSHHAVMSNNMGGTSSSYNHGTPPVPPYFQGVPPFVNTGGRNNMPDLEIPHFSEEQHKSPRDFFDDEHQHHEHSINSFNPNSRPFIYGKHFQNDV